MTLLDLIVLLKRHIRLVVILPLVCAAAMAGVAFGMMPDTYTATTSMYILSKSGDAQGSLSSADLSASQMITSDVAKLMKSDRVVSEAASSMGLTDLDDFSVSVSSEATTRVISVSVTGSDPKSVAAAASGLAKSVSKVAQEVMDVHSVNIIDDAEVPEHPSGPKRLAYTAIAFLAGLFAAVAVVVIRDILDTKVRGSEDVEEILGVPVIGRIPVMKEGK